MGRVIYMFFFAIFGIQDKNKHIVIATILFVRHAEDCQCMKFTNITIFSYIFSAYF